MNEKGYGLLPPRACLTNLLARFSILLACPIITSLGSEWSPGSAALAASKSLLKLLLFFQKAYSPLVLLHLEAHLSRAQT